MSIYWIAQTPVIGKVEILWHVEADSFRLPSQPLFLFNHKLLFIQDRPHRFNSDNSSLYPLCSSFIFEVERKIQKI